MHRITGLGESSCGPDKDSSIHPLPSPLPSTKPVGLILCACSTTLLSNGFCVGKDANMYVQVPYLDYDMNLQVTAMPKGKVHISLSRKQVHNLIRNSRQLKT